MLNCFELYLNILKFTKKNNNFALYFKSVFKKKQSISNVLYYKSIEYRFKRKSNRYIP